MTLTSQTDLRRPNKQTPQQLTGCHWHPPRRQYLILAFLSRKLLGLSTDASSLFDFRAQDWKLICPNLINFLSLVSFLVLEKTVQKSLKRHGDNSRLSRENNRIEPTTPSIAQPATRFPIHKSSLGQFGSHSTLWLFELLLSWRSWRSRTLGNLLPFNTYE